MCPRSLALVACCSLLAGCGLDGVSAGVEVVPIVDESRSVADAEAESSAVAAPGADGGVADAVEPAGDDAPVDEVVGTEADLPATVAVIGDSLTLSSQQEIELALTEIGLDVLVVDGVESRRMVRGGRDLPPGTSAIADVLEAGLAPELWIIALGTNDVGSDGSPESFRDDVATVLARIPAGAPVIWVDVWIRDRSTESAAANRQIRSVAALRPATRVVDWYTHGDDPGIIVGDGVHLTDAGERLFAASMAASVEAMYGG